MTGLLTITEAAELLRVSESWLRKQAGKRAIPFHLISRKIRFSQQDIDSILEQTQKTPARRAARTSPAGLGIAGRPVSSSPRAGRPAQGRAS